MTQPQQFGVTTNDFLLAIGSLYMELHVVRQQYQQLAQQQQPTNMMESDNATSQRAVSNGQTQWENHPSGVPQG